jgi:hypothetical protein
MSQVTIPIQIEGFLKVFDPNNGEVFYDGHNAIHYENISIAIADTLSSRGYGSIYKMAFGNGGANVDETGVITYLPTNTIGQNAGLYNQTYMKIVDDTSVLNTDTTRNKMLSSHTTGKVYTDIIIQCLLDYGEPAGQLAFDTATKNKSSFVFDEIGLLADYGTDVNGNELTKLLTHVIFHPVQKSLNRQIQIDYTIRIQSLTNLITV